MFRTGVWCLIAQIIFYSVFLFGCVSALRADISKTTIDVVVWDTIPFVSISGKVQYYSNNAPIKDANLTMSGQISLSKHSDSNGNYEFTDFEKAADILQEYKIEKLPVVDADYKLVGLITYKDIIKIKERPNACKDERGRLRVAAAVGVARDTIDRVAALVKEEVDAIVIDTAHGHSEGVMYVIKTVREKFPEIDLIVGNIGTEEAAGNLAELGVSAVKVGIGPGSICTTRIIAGVGIPQLTAIYNVAKGLKGTGIPVIADGGIRYTGDIVKAIAAGAHTIMAGSVFAGVDESPGETIIFEGRKYKTYRGMGSIEAMQKGSKDRYFQDVEDDIKKLVPEGIVGRVPFKGGLSEVIHQMVGGLRAGMGYTGSKDIDELQQAKFIKITAAGVVESHPHDITITREAPNYSR